MSRCAFVTGGAGFLGESVCQKLASEGYEVTLTAISEAERQRYTGPGTVEIADLSTRTGADSCCAKLPERVHAVALLAGGFAMQPIEALTEDDLHRMCGINFATAALTIAALIPKLEAAGGSSVVVVGSPAYVGASGMAAYAASKAALVSFAASAALELKPKRIRVNAILPNVLDTPPNRAAMPNADFDTWAKTEEAAEVISFLLSPASRIISGELINLRR